MARKIRRTHKSSRKSSNLKTTNILVNTSAKSQAYQIKALRNRISYIYKQVKPEIAIT